MEQLVQDKELLRKQLFDRTREHKSFKDTLGIGHERVSLMGVKNKSLKPIFYNVKSTENL